MLVINSKRLAAELEELSLFSASQKPAVTRILYSEEDLQARDYLKKLCEEAGLEVREDAIGNTFARWKGSDDSLPAIGTGSHMDAIPESGMYDGTVGVLGGLEVIRALKESGFQPRRSLELLLFTAEEPTRFGIGCLGSRMLSGKLIPEEALRLKDFDNNDFEAVRKKAGFTDKHLESVKLPETYYHAFLELHIEQGPLLEKNQTDIGIVTNIAAPGTLQIKLKGTGGHAGAVLMPERHDACNAAAEIALAVEAAALSTGSPDTVATTGIFEIKPGAVNSIPREAYLEVDLRDTQVKTRDEALANIKTAIREICERRGVEQQTILLNCDPPATCDAALVKMINSICDELGYSAQQMISRAYHDSLFMAQLFPTCMIFIPCRGGVSHRPDEYASAGQIEKGVRVLAMAMRQLGGEG